MTKEEKYLSNNGYGKGTNYTTELVASLLSEYAKEYATQIVLDKLPGDEIEQEGIKRYGQELGRADRPLNRSSFNRGGRWAVQELSQRITTRSEVEKPFRDMLTEILKDGISVDRAKRMKQLINQ